jgi:two-component system, chemotaxis family, CheB/CheR fusion protein
VQHLDPNRHSLALEIISKETKIKLIEIKDGIQIEPNRLYVQPSNTILEYSQNTFKLTPRADTPFHLTIDHIFTTLSEEIRNRAIGIILSGTGSDGTYGLKAIKANGGITFVQEPSTAKFNEMPKSAIAAGAADYVGSPEEIAEQLISIIEQHDFPIAEEDSDDSQDHEEKNEKNLKEIFQIIHQVTSVDFSLYKSPTVIRRIKRRMVMLKFQDFDSYKKHIKGNKLEIQTLYDDILIHVTEFFRDPESFESLRKNVFPEIVKNHNQHSALRLWTAGCSTGEETYSIVISLIEYLESINLNIPIQVFATDISERAISSARLALYPETITKNISKERLAKFFQKTPNGYKVNKNIRDLCLFSKHDMTSDPPFAKLDFISCRNVLIYFSIDLQKKIIPTFHYALNNNGFLWLGKSETCGNFPNLFSLESKSHKYYKKSDAPSQVKFSFPAKYPFGEIPNHKSETLPVVQNYDFQKEADQLVLNQFSSPSVVINSELDILQFRGRCVPFLEPSVGQPSMNLFKMARPEIQAGLRLLFRSVKEENRLVERHGFSISTESNQTHFSILIHPLNPAETFKDRKFLVMFTNISIIKKDGVNDKIEIDSEQEISVLLSELAEAKEFQKALIEESDANQEELTSTNEELQSSNEELQSTNEELETAKEELQSTNEELTTVNEELQLRNYELTNISSDLSNLLSSTEIPILMVASDGNIRRFTEEAREAFNLIPSDVGRPIKDIQSNFGLDLTKLINDVGHEKKPRRIEVQDKRGAWKHLQIHPYKNLENEVDGVSITLLDIDQLKQKENDVKQSLNYIKSVADSVPLPFAVVGADFSLKTANRSFYKYFNITTNSNDTDFFKLLAIPDNYRSTLKTLILNNITNNKPFSDFEINCKLLHAGTRKMLLSGGKVQWVGDEPEAALISFIDITERSRLENELTRLLVLEREARDDAEKANRAKDVFLATLSHELRTPLSAILTWSQLIGSDRLDAPTTKQGAAVIEQSAKTQSQLIDDLLDISRIISGKLSLTIKDVDSAAVIRSAVESVRSLGVRKNIQIETRLSPEQGRILADPVRLQQIIWNLLTNAIKFSPKDSKIEISLEFTHQQERRYAVIKVIDHGKGIPKDFLPNVFNRFSQADSASTRLHGGLGLGLSIVNNLVELQGGTVTAENGGRGVGAILSVSFPVIPTDTDILQTHSSDSNQTYLNEDNQPCLNMINILFVDDNDSTRDALIIYLKSFGAKVKSADCVKSAMKQFKDFRPDILVSDIAMPTEDGYSLIRRIRKLSPDKGGLVPAIALTAYASAEDSEIAIEAGFNSHVAKPVEAQVLAREIIKLIKDGQKSQTPLIHMINNPKKD